jgi:hypothetical protein
MDRIADSYSRLFDEVNALKDQVISAKTSVNQNTAGVAFSTGLVRPLALLSLPTLIFLSGEI